MFFLRPDVVGLNVLKYTLLFRGHVETSKGRLQHRRCNSLYKFTWYFPKNLEGIKYKKIIKWFSNSNSLLKILNKITPGLYSAAYINYLAGNFYFRFDVHVIWPQQWDRTILCYCGDFSTSVTTKVCIHHMFDHWRIHMRNLLWGMVAYYPQ